MKNRIELKDFDYSIRQKIICSPKNIYRFNVTYYEDEIMFIYYNTVIITCNMTK